MSQFLQLRHHHIFFQKFLWIFLFLFVLAWTCRFLLAAWHRSSRLVLLAHSLRALPNPAHCVAFCPLPVQVIKSWSLGRCIVAFEASISLRFLDASWKFLQKKWGDSIIFGFGQWKTCWSHFERPNIHAIFVLLQDFICSICIHCSSHHQCIAFPLWVVFNGQTFDLTSRFFNEESTPQLESSLLGGLSYLAFFTWTTWTQIPKRRINTYPHHTNITIAKADPIPLDILWCINRIFYQ